MNRSKALHAMSTKAEQYKCIAMSTGHLSEAAKAALTEAATKTVRGEGGGGGGMVMERDTGWFVKMYSADDCAPNETMFPGFPDDLEAIFGACREAGYQLVEFDADASDVAGLDWHADASA